MPLATPALAVLAIFSVVWRRKNDFLWPLIVINNPNLYTLQLGLAQFSGSLVTDWNSLLALTVLTMVPLTIVFAVLQRYLVSGIAATGIKG